MKIESIKNKHKGQSCFVVGNGPSLANTDVKLLANKITLCSNQYYTHPNIKWTPTYYFVEDQLGFKMHKERVVNVKSNLRFFEDVQQDNVPDKSNTHFLKIIRDRDNIGFQKDLKDPISCGYCVTHFQLQVAYYMGFSTVYLIGMDHNKGHFVSEKEYHGNKKYSDRLITLNEIAFNKAKDVFTKDNRKILNATIGGQLEIFPRVNYKEILK